MKTITRIAGGVLIASAFFGFASAGAVSAAPARAAVTAASSSSLTQGFEISNYSRFPMKLASLDNAGSGDSKLKVGTVLEPGQSMRYEKVFWFWGTPDTQLNFSYSNGNMVYGSQISLQIEKFLNIPTVGHWNDPGAPVQSTVTGAATSTQITFKDTTENTIQVPPSEAQRRADLISGLCENTAATCTFDRTKPREIVKSNREVAIDGGINNTANLRTFTSTQTHLSGSSTSVDLTLSAKAGLDKVFEVSMTSKYNLTYNYSDTDVKARGYSISPYHVGVFVASMPMVRDYGNLTITLGNTTWVLTDIYVDSLDKSRDITFHSNERKLTDAERAAYAKDVDNFFPAPGQVKP